MKPIELFVIDDHNLFRRGLIALLKQDGRFVIANEAGDLGQALRCAGQIQPDVILLDNHLPGVRGIEGIPALKQAFETARILILTVSEDAEDLAAAMQAGADGYLLKTVESEQLCQSILRVIAGEPAISPEMMTKFVAMFRTKEPSASVQETELHEGLSSREREILLLVALGDSNKLIARKLNIAETTVKVHVQAILRKLQINSRVQAAVYAANHGLI